MLRWLVDMGADEAVDDAPIDRYAASATPAAALTSFDQAVLPPANAPVPRPASPPPPAALVVAPRAKVAIESPQLVADARALATACNTVEELEHAIRGFDGCALKRTARTTVFAEGPADAPVLVIGEAPGADEDRLGKPFVGVSGQLLDRMFATIGYSRRENLRITNVIFWRPPGNRTPTPGETAICVAFTHRHIELVRPRVLVLAGAVPVRTMLDTTEGITKLRGRWTSYALGDGTSVPVLPTFHPAYLLRTPGSKRQSWRDLLLLQERLEQLSVASS